MTYSNQSQGIRYFEVRLVAFLQLSDLSGSIHWRLRRVPIPSQTEKEYSWAIPIHIKVKGINEA